MDVIMVASFAENTWWNYNLGFPVGGFWNEVFNSDVYDNWVNPWVAGNGTGVWANGAPMHVSRHRPRLLFLPMVSWYSPKPEEFRIRIAARMGPSQSPATQVRSPWRSPFQGWSTSSGKVSTRPFITCNGKFCEPTFLAPKCASPPAPPRRGARACAGAIRRGPAGSPRRDRAGRNRCASCTESGGRPRRWIR